MSALARVWRHAWIFLVLLSGCAAPQLDESSAWVLQQREGRFSVQIQQATEPAQGLQGSFTWRRLASGWQLDLKSPLGATLARLTSTSAGATLERPDAAVRTAASGEQLLASVLGVAIPVAVLEDWIEGRVRDDGQVTDLVRNDQGQAVSFSAGPWRVVLDRYTEQGPGRVTVRSTQAGRDVSLRLLIDQQT